MSVKRGTIGVVPNWIKTTDFKNKSDVVNKISELIAYSPRDWSQDPELWAIYTLVYSGSKADAQKCWELICDDPTTDDIRLRSKDLHQNQPNG